MSVTKTETIGWGSRIGESFKGMLSGAVMLIVSFPLLFWNEGRAVKTAKALDEGEGACISVSSNAKIDPQYEGQLVHMIGKADTKSVPEDAKFGVSSTVIRLERSVEMYQWQEDSHTTEKKNLGGSVTKTTEYTYKKVWSGNVIDSSEFQEAGHDNPAEMEFKGEQWFADAVSFGAFKLNESQIRGIGRSVSWTPPADWTCRVARVTLSDSKIYVPNKETRDNLLNKRDVISAPRIGDMRVTFKMVHPHEISLVAVQEGETFAAYRAKNGKRIAILADGRREAADLFEGERTRNSIGTWTLRLFGFLLMYGGLCSLLRPLSVIGDVVPIVGTILDKGVKLVAGAVAAVCWLITVALAWIFYRPVIGVTLLVLVIVPIVWVVLKRKKTVQSPDTPKNA